MHRRERLLEDLYSDPESHSLKWIWSVIAINAGWWIIRYIFGTTACLNDWMYIAAYLYMTVYILFVFTKVINYAEPVSLETQEAMERPLPTSPQNGGDNGGESHIVARLKSLMEKEQMYLKPDLTIEKKEPTLVMTPASLFALKNLRIQ